MNDLTTDTFCPIPSYQSCPTTIRPFFADFPYFPSSLKITPIHKSDKKATYDIYRKLAMWRLRRMISGVLMIPQLLYKWHLMTSLFSEAIAKTGSYLTPYLTRRCVLI